MIKQPSNTVNNDGKYVLTENYNFTVRGLTYLIRKGFKWDGASVPRFAWSFLRPDGRIRAASLVHDYIYAKHKALGITRHIADSLFYEMMLDAGIPKYKAYTAYYAVRWFGGSHWGK
jgi:hypothetical protein